MEKVKPSDNLIMSVESLPKAPSLRVSVDSLPKAPRRRRTIKSSNSPRSPRKNSSRKNSSKNGENPQSPVAKVRAPTVQKSPTAKSTFSSAKTIKKSATAKATEKGLERINIDEITEIPKTYPQEFNDFVKENGLKPPPTTSKQGKALAIMLANPKKYFDRDSAIKFFEKFGIETKDSIQQFNKHEQWGIKPSGIKGIYFIPHPYSTATKHTMRKNFSKIITAEQKNAEIDKIKSTIKTDYIDVPNEEWELGHKNPESTDNTSTNLVLQPPIQGKYRDRYIFIDTLTKIPTPKTFVEDFKSGKSPYTKEQMSYLKKMLNAIEEI